MTILIGIYIWLLCSIAFVPIWHLAVTHGRKSWNEEGDYEE